MTAYDLTRAAPRSGFLTTLVASITAWNEARQTRNALERLSDHELADIGLSRGEIEDVALRLTR